MRYIASCAMLLAAMAAGAATRYDSGHWTLQHNDDCSLDIQYKGRTILSNVFATSTYNLLGESDEYEISTGAGTSSETASYDVEDEFGHGTSYTFAVSDGRVRLVQSLNIYDSHPYIIAGSSIEAADGSTVQSRRMIPLATRTSSYPVEGSSQRMIWVPFDNDSHTMRYQSEKMNGDMTSSEVTGIFEPSSRQGLVVGSVDHDKWKSGIYVDGRSGGRLAALECLSGFTDPLITRDGLPHGKVKGKTVASARYMLGMFDDWREGFNTFADANTTVVPRAEWKEGNPVGWSSWGTMMNYVNYSGVMECAEFMHENLRPLGFEDAAGHITISLDSWGQGNLGDANCYKMGTKIFSDGTYREGRETKEGMHMNLGMYGGMVVWDWTLDSHVKGTGLNGQPDYNWGDCTLKVNGKPYTISANNHDCALDPTHPAVRANLEFTFREWASMGVRYVKMDFINSSIREGDSWYDPEVTTGVMAYNYGMKIVKDLADQYGMYIVQAMSPLFPYQYAHGRRTCCDRWGRLEESEFVMNPISYGWWTDRLYTVNDPDQMVLCQNGHNASETMGENRVRATSGMATGAYIFGDNFGYSTFYTDGDNKGKPIGYADESRRRALEIMGNSDINEYVRTHTGSFMPVEGDNPSTRQDAESVFMRDTEQYLYVAVFNWMPLLPRSGSVSFDRLGIASDNVGDIKELWSGEAVSPEGDGIAYQIPAGDVKVYRISKLDYKGNGVGETLPDSDILEVAIKGGLCIARADREIASLSLYDMTGRLVACGSGSGRTAAVTCQDSEGVYTAVCSMADGTVRHSKVMAR